MQTKKTEFDQNWKSWIQTNVALGSSRDVIFKILLDEGFDHQVIKKEMNYEPSVPAFMLVNPMKSADKSVQKSSDKSTEQTTKANASAVNTKIVKHEIYLPNARKLETEKADFFELDNFLTAHECQRVIELINSEKRPSTLSSEERDKAFRTSMTCDLGAIDDSLLKDIDSRICRYMGIDESYSESIQGQHYEIGQEFKPHTDYFESNELQTHGVIQGQRTFTFMIYLNEVDEGGETVFPELNTSVKPALGKAVIWNSLDRTGQVNFNTLHHATPVTKGTKSIITKWFRMSSRKQPASAMFVKEENEFIRNYTQQGFYKSQFPANVFAEIKRFYRENGVKITAEHVPGDFIFTPEKKKLGSSLVNLSEPLRQKIHDTMKPLMEHWAGVELEPTFVYGIRVYHRNAILKSHRDRLETHIISAIINVDQIIEQDWPLIIEDNYYRQHEVILKPGEMIFYEGGRLIHGRPTPLKGQLFANIFCHFKPIGYVHRQF
jgi:prolyl 4-hydroxylase